MARYDLTDGRPVRDPQMPQWIERARRRGRVLLLDPGSATIHGALARWDVEAEAAAVAPVRRTILAGFASVPSRGLGSHGVTDAAAFQRALREVVDRVESRARRGAVDEVLVSVQSRSLSCHHARGDARIAGDLVTERDILRALNRCARPPGGARRAVLHAMPVQFSVDDRDGIIDPRGLAGSSIIADLIWITVDRAPLDELHHCLEACGLKPAGFVAAPFALGFAGSGELRPGTGYACIDLGASATGVGVFLRHRCLHCSVLPMGGATIAARVAQTLGLDPEEAEKARRGGRAGKAFPEARPIIQNATRLLFAQVRALLEEVEFYQMPGRMVRLGGGGAHDPEVREIAAEILACPVGPVRAHNVWWPSEQAAEPEFIGLQGLALLARESPMELRDLERASAGSVVGMVRRTLQWVMSNW